MAENDLPGGLNDFWGIVNTTAELQCSGLPQRHHLLESYDFELLPEARGIVEERRDIEFIPQMNAFANRKPPARIYITRKMREWING